MKKTLAVLLILTSAASSFASHAYRDETCVSTTHKLEYSGSMVGSPYKLTNLKTNGEAEIYTNEDARDQGDVSSFEIIASKVISEKVKKESCKQKNVTGFDEETYKTQEVVSFSNLSQEAIKQSGISAGTYMIFNCSAVETYPNQCD